VVSYIVLLTISNHTFYPMLFPGTSFPVWVCISALSLLVVCVWSFYRVMVSNRRSRILRERMRNKRKERDEKTHSSLSEPSVDPPVMIDAVQLIEELTAGTRTYSSVMLSCIRRSHDIGKLKLNAVTEELYDEGYECAKSLDALRRSRTKWAVVADKPLLGVPISIKDCFAQRGTDCTLGIAARCFMHHEEDGLLVKLLRDAGAIPFVRSNVPQLLMMPESDNCVWGASNNPYDVFRTTGGSSGGEGALIASGCSAMGLGSDIGGSIRIPAHYCGIVGFKPTPALLTKNGAASNRFRNRNGQIAVVPTAGPMARSVRDCAAMMSVLCSAEARKEDMTVPPVLWRSDVVENGRPMWSVSPTETIAEPQCLKIAVMTTDHWFEPVPACKRAVDVAVEALRSMGHTVVSFEPPCDGWKVVSTYIKLMSADGNWYSFIRALEGEELSDSYRKLQIFTEIPNFLRLMIISALNMMGESRKAMLLEITKSGGLDVREYWEAVADMKEIQEAYGKAFKANEYDAMILPALGITAPPHGMAAELLSALSYTFLGNLLHWPGGVVPVTTVLHSILYYAYTVMGIH